MLKVCKDMSVDAGMLCIADVGYLKRHHATIEKYGDRADIRRLIPLKPGEYYINYRIKNTYLGDLEGTIQINCNSGMLLVGDPCYNFPNEGDSWSNFLNEISYGSCQNEFFTAINTGGDGGFTIKLEITPCPLPS